MQLSRLHVRHYNKNVPRSALVGGLLGGVRPPLLLTKNGNIKPIAYREMSSFLRILGRSALKIRYWVLAGTASGGYAASKVNLTIFFFRNQMSVK